MLIGAGLENGFGSRFSGLPSFYRRMLLPLRCIAFGPVEKGARSCQYGSV